MTEKIIYQLIEEDVQMVAEQTLDRRLSSSEVLSLIDSIAEKINWFEAIEYAIYDIIEKDQDASLT